MPEISARVRPRVLDSDKAKLFCTREEIKQWRRERGSCADYLDYCTQVLASHSTDAGHDAGDDGVGDGGGDAGLGLDATAPPFIPAASGDSEVPQRKDRGESPARGDAATSLEGAAKQAGLGGGDTPAGQCATLLLDYNLPEGTDAALPRFTMRRGMQCGR